MDERGPEVSEADVAAFEARLGHRLPESYRRFLLDVNGGTPASSHSLFARGIAHSLFGLNEPSDGSDLELCRQYSPDLPDKSLLEIGGDQGGNPILLVVGPGAHHGEIWFQSRSDPRPEDSNPRVLWHDRRDVKKVADSFEEFMASLGSRNG